MTDELSLAQRLALLPEDERERFLEETFTPEQRAALQYDWGFWGRPKQQEPAGDWVGWLVLAGRGWGKTQTGAEWVYRRVRRGEARRVGLIAPTTGDVRDVMVEGPAGIMASGYPEERPEYLPSRRLLRFPNGAQATTFSADEPDRLRGPQHDTLWFDEPAAWRYLRDAYDMATMGLRQGRNPRWMATTTPRPLPLIKEWLGDTDVHVTRGSSYENLVNLAPTFRKAILERYEGTRLGRQELNAEVLDDNPLALWTREMVEAGRVGDYPRLVRVVVGVDPGASDDPETAAENGIVVVGMDQEGDCYVLDDYSRVGSPHVWGAAVATAYHRYQADRVVGEVNNGGDMVRYVVETSDPTVNFKEVRASRGKSVRAEPVSSLYEKDPPRVHHVGAFPELEDQLCEWDQTMDDSPDRLDALVWAITELKFTGVQADDVSPRLAKR